MKHIEDYLKNLGISELNPMQREVMEKNNKESDLILLSPTGSGKTLAYLLLVIDQLGHTDPKGIRGLIIVPTRELAIQIESVFRLMQTGMVVQSLYGGQSTRSEREKMKNTPDLLIATPGRLLYHLNRLSTLLADLQLLILDEFDKSLELGFQEQLAEILAHGASSARKVLTSATSLEELPAFVELNQPATLNYLNKEDPNLRFNNYLIASPSSLKLEMLFKLLCRIGDQRVLVFCNHRETTRHVTDLLEKKGIRAQAYHGGMEQWERELTLIKLRNGSCQILITTDLAARGLDIDEMNHVVHYQWPVKAEDFIHRNGRTGRQGKPGYIYGLSDPEKPIPEFFQDAEPLVLDDYHPVPALPDFRTLRIDAGKKQKINKVDIVGYFLSFPEVKKEDIGLITVKAEESFVAVRRGRATEMLRSSADARIKKSNVRVRLV